MSKIMINNTFNENDGSYAKLGNIVHETINLLTADDNKHYIYTPPYGTLSEKNRKIDFIFMVRAFGKQTVQVVALAKGLKYRYNEEENRNIKYGGKTLYEIFAGNTENDDQYITFEADEVLVPKETILLTNDSTNKSGIYIDKKIRNQSMKSYFDNNEELEALIENDSLWDKADFPKVSEADFSPVKNNFFNIIKQEDNEVIFSNMFAYFFLSYPDLFVKFADEFMGIKNLENTFKIEREKNYIDLYITDKTHYIIIENKIKSGINRVKKDGYQDSKIESQLSRYYKTVLEENKEDETNISCFILSPNYAHFNLSDYAYGDKYTELKYSSIYEFYSKNKESIKADDSVYFEIFLTSMEKHIKSKDTDIEERMIARFIQRTRSI